MTARTIKFGDQDWKVTSFHCVVGPITRAQFVELYDVFWKRLGGIKLIDRPDPFAYVSERASNVVKTWRRWSSERGEALCYTGDPLFVNELQPEEVTLACIEDSKITLTNFADLPGIQDALKVFKLGEFWVSYATGGAELPLRTGKARG